MCLLVSLALCFDTTDKYLEQVRHLTTTKSQTAATLLLMNIENRLVLIFSSCGWKRKSGKLKLKTVGKHGTQMSLLIIYIIHSRSFTLFIRDYASGVPGVRDNTTGQPLSNDPPNYGHDFWYIQSHDNRKPNVSNTAAGSIALRFKV